MALQIWLPLLGNLNNQGLYPVSWINSNATVSDNGKIGKCYSFSSTTGNGIYNTSQCADFMNSYINNHSFSICMWAKSTSTDTTLISLTCGLRMFAGTNPSINLYNSSRIVSASNPISTADGNWHHLCGTYNKDSGKITMYVDGVPGTSSTYTSGYTYSSSWNNGLFIGRDSNNNVANSHFYFQGSMNDVKIFDHCLSQKEITEISKGLVLHYPLDNEGLGSPNLIANSQQERAGVYNGSMLDFAYWNNLTVNPNEIYTVSFDAKSTVDNQNMSVFFYNNTSGIVQVSSSTNSIGGKSTSQDGYNVIKLTQSYMRYWITWTFNSGTAAKKNLLFRLYDGNATLKNIKLEKSNKATNWCPNVNDSLYSGLGMDSNTVTDVSGYGYDGNISGTLTYSTDSQVNNGSYYFTSNGSITVGNNIFNVNQTLDGLTLSAWIKTNTLNNTCPNIISLGGNSFARYRLITATSMWYYFRVGSTQCTNTFTCKNLLDNEWHLTSVTFNKGYVKMYVDGECIGTTNHISTATYMTCASTQAYVGGYNSTSEKFVGNISDVKIYTTALSDSDIKELYSARFSVDDTGNFYCYGIDENDDNLTLNQNGVISLSSVSTDTLASQQKTRFFDKYLVCNDIYEL